MRVGAILLPLILVFNSVFAQEEAGPVETEMEPGAIEADGGGSAPDEKPILIEEAPVPLLSMSVSAPLEDIKSALVEEEVPLLKCPLVCDNAKLSERIKSWLCEYTNYKIEAMKWKDEVENLWSNCDEYDDIKSIWKSSFDCAKSKVKCKYQENLVCTYIGMDCSVCACSDGKYKDPMEVYKLWKDEMAMFRKRHEIYRTIAESCTLQSSMESPGCDTVEPNESMQADGPDSETRPSKDFSESKSEYVSESGSEYFEDFLEYRSGSGFSGDLSGSGSGAEGYVHLVYYGTKIESESEIKEEYEKEPMLASRGTGDEIEAADEPGSP